VLRDFCNCLSDPLYYGYKTQRKIMTMIASTSTATSTYTDQASGGLAATLRSEPSRPVPTAAGSEGTEGAAVEDRVTLSADGRARAREAVADDGSGQDPNNPPARDKAGTSSPDQLSPDEQQTVQKLKKRDTEVKQHEAAHLAAAGQYAAGGPSYTYQTGPDGRRYAIGGEVPIDVSREKTPEQTIQKMRIVRQAALAPAHPSGADHAIAASASMKESEARRELNTEETDHKPGPEAAAADVDSADPDQPDAMDQAAMHKGARPISTYA
jgi:hypothetical protein